MKRSSHLSPLHVEKLPGGSVRLLANFRWRDVVVPAGFVCDLDSVPRLPFVYWLLKNRATQSAVVHDWLYHAGENRATADVCFLLAMIDEGVALRHRLWIFLAVRLFGWWAYRQHRRMSSAGADVEIAD